MNYVNIDGPARDYCISTANAPEKQLPYINLRLQFNLLLMEILQRDRGQSISLQVKAV